MARIALITLVLIGIAAGASAKDAKIGEASIDLVMPAGFCELDEKYPADARALTSLGKLISGGGNQLLAFAADCQQLADWRVGKRAVLDDFVQYQTPVRFADKPLEVAPGAFIKQFCAVLRTQGEKLLSAAAPDINSRIEEALRLVKVNETTFVGVLAEDSTACYTALLQKLKTETGPDKTQTAVNAITIVKGKVVYFYLFSLYTGRDSIDATLAKQKVNLGAFIAANKN
jgi:hypothetical protein